MFSFFGSVFLHILSAFLCAVIVQPRPILLLALLHFLQALGVHNKNNEAFGYTIMVSHFLIAPKFTISLLDGLILLFWYLSPSVVHFVLIEQCYGDKASRFSHIANPIVYNWNMDKTNSQGIGVAI